jgi:hypothetical protein
MDGVQLRFYLSKYNLKMYLATGSPLSKGLPDNHHSLRAPWYGGSKTSRSDAYARNIKSEFSDGFAIDDDMYIVGPGPGHIEENKDFELDPSNWLVIDARKSVADHWSSLALITPLQDPRPLFFIQSCSAEFRNPYVDCFGAGIHRWPLLGCFLTNTRRHDKYWGRPDVDCFQQPYFVLSLA